MSKKKALRTQDPTIAEFERMAKYYKKGEGPSFLEILVQSDVIEGTKYLLNSGWYVDAEKRKITCKPGIEHNSPWVYVNPNPNMYCGQYRQVFEIAKVVHSYCMECWKVVVKPKTVHQLFQLYEAQMKVAVPNKWYCKCGTEEREYVPQNYGGYFYCRGYDQGRERWLQVRKMVDDHIDQSIDHLSKLKDLHVPVTLKRYCTEFELKLGPTNEYVRPVHADLVEKRIVEALDSTVLRHAKPTQFMINHVMKKWLLFAWNIGDMTCLRYNDDKMFYKPSVTYHDDLERKYYGKKENDIDQDQAVGAASDQETTRAAAAGL